MLKDRCWQFSLSDNEKISLIVDASGSAARYKSKIIDVVNELLKKVPYAQIREIFFLGGDRGYSTEEFKHPAKLFDENSGQISLVGPLLRNISSGSKPLGKFVVIGSGKIFDLEDWIDYGHWVFVKVGGQSLVGGLPTTEVSCENLDRAICQLVDPIEKVKINVPDWMPHNWDNPHYVWEDGSLLANNLGELTAWTVNITAFVIEPLQPAANLFFQSGRKERIYLSETPVFPNPLDWHILSETEIRLYQNAIHGKRFQCPICKQEHQPSQLQCTSENEWGIKHLVYPTIEKFGWNRGYILFRELGQVVEVCRLGQTALRLSDIKVAILENDERRIFQFNKKQERWSPDPSPWKEYLEIEGNVRVVFL
jgi:hypothetical protein